MNKIHITGILLALSTLWACNNKNPMDEEQYFKQIYLVGAYDHVFTQTVYYNDTEAQETFISVAASGSLGLDEDVNVTVGIFPEELIIQPHNTGAFDLSPHDRFLLCSDGLTDMLAEREIAFLLKQPGSLAQAGNLLYNEALARGGRDNITVLLVESR